MLYRFLRSYKEEVVLFLIFFFAYLFSGYEKVLEQDFLNYPFGSDPPCYTQFLNRKPDPGNYMIFRHPVTAVYCLTFNELTRPVRKIFSLEVIYKFPFALIGAINVLIALRIFRQFIKKHCFLCSMAYGFTSVIWFFGAFPESYGVTAFLISLYLLFILKYRDGLDHRKLFVITVLFMLGIMNEPSFVFLLIIPIVIYGRDFLAGERKIGKYFIFYTLTACVLLYIMFAAFCYSTFKRSPIKYYRYQYNVSHERNYNRLGNTESWLTLQKTGFLNFYFFNIAFPEDHVNHMVPQYGDYVGYFKPSLMNYFDNVFSIIFLVAYIVLLFYGAKGIILDRDRIIIALLMYIFLRSVFIFLFNPTEALLYSSVIVLPLMVILFYYFEKSRFKFKMPFLIAFILSLIWCNASFFI